MSAVDGVDVFDALVARASAGRLQLFNAAGILTPSDFHVARLPERARGSHRRVHAAGGRVRGPRPRLGHVCVDLTTIRHTASSDIDREVEVDALPWPEPDEWLRGWRGAAWSATTARCISMARTSTSNRLWLDEVAVGRDLLARAAAPAPGVDAARLAQGLATLFEGTPTTRTPTTSSRWRRPPPCCGGCRSSPEARGPARRPRSPGCWPCSMRRRPPPGARPRSIALAAPTGKAAARLEEAVRAEAAGLDVDRRGPRPVAGAARHHHPPLTRLSIRAIGPGSAITGQPFALSTWSWSTRRRWSRCR